MTAPSVRRQATRLYLIDLAERVVMTFLEAFIGVLLLAGADVLTLSALKAAVVAGIIAVLALLKGLLAKVIGDRWSASTAPSVAVHTAPTK